MQTYLSGPIGALRTFLWIFGLFSPIMGVLLVIHGVNHNASLNRETRPLEPGIDGIDSTSLPEEVL